MFVISYGHVEDLAMVGKINATQDRQWAVGTVFGIYIQGKYPATPSRNLKICLDYEINI